MIDIDKLLQGSIDMHIHHGPDTSITGRRVDAFSAAKQAQQAGMRAIVLKNHDYTTAPSAYLARQMVPGIEVFGGLTLDYQSGGLNYIGVETSAQLGAKILWGPTFSSINSRAKVRARGFALEGDGYSVIDGDGKLVPEMDRILQLVKKYDLIQATGHISPPEAFALVARAREMGLWKLIITHPLSTQVLDKTFTLDELVRIAQMGAFIELTAIDFSPSEYHDPAHMIEAIKKIGAEHFIMSTDLGQHANPGPAEGMRIFMSVFIRKGITEKEIEIMAKINPARLLGLN